MRMTMDKEATKGIFTSSDSTEVKACHPVRRTEQEYFLIDRDNI